MHSHIGGKLKSRYGQQVVLILVVMEDALAHVTDKDWDVSEKVLILVVMEDALALCFKSFNFRNKSLNPCCNGRCTRTPEINNF